MKNEYFNFNLLPFHTIPSGKMFNYNKNHYYKIYIYHLLNTCAFIVH